MEVYKLLSGQELVIKGGLKRASSLPTRGIKDVLSCGSYAEAHQVANTLRIRKELIQDERIEKWGILSQAEWIKEKQMALVTKQQGPHWSYIGHTEVGNKLYLYPEETLYLMEMNSLQLRYGGVLVSFQQAYALLFQDAQGLHAYKVYSSLCRKGYKLLRHSWPKTPVKDETSNNKNILDRADKSLDCESNYGSPDWRTYPVLVVERETDSRASKDKPNDDSSIKSKIIPKQLSITWHRTDSAIPNIDLTTDNARQTTIEQEQEMEVECLDSDDCEIIELPTSKVVRNEQDVLNSNTPKNFRKDIHFTNDPGPPKLDNSLLPNLIGKNIAALEAPPQSLIPPNIRLNKKHYFIDLKNMHKRFLNNEKESLLDDSEKRIVIEERNVLSITCGDNDLIEKPKKDDALPQNNIYTEESPLRHIPDRNLFWNSNFNQRQSPFYHVNHVCSNPFQFGYFQSNFRYNPTGIQNLFFQKYGSHYNKQQQFSDRNIQSNASANRNVVNKTRKNCSTMSQRESVKIIQMKNQMKRLELIKQCAMKYKELINKQALPNISRLLQSLLCTYNEKYNDFIFLNRRYEIEHAGSENLSSDSDYKAVACAPGKRRKRIKTKNQKRPKESNVCYLSSSDEDCIPILTELNERNKAKNTQISEKNMEMLTRFKGWMPTNCTDFGRPALKSNPRQRDQMSEAHQNVIFNQFVNCIAKNRFENWRAVKIAFKRSMSASILLLSEDCIDNNYNTNTAIKCDKIKSIIRSEDCRSVRSILNRINIIKSAGSGDGQELKISYDVHLPTKKYLRNSPPLPAFRVICLNESDAIPNPSSIALRWSHYGVVIPLVFAVVGRDAISYVQMGPVDIPTLGLQED